VVQCTTYCGFTHVTCEPEHSICCEHLPKMLNVLGLDGDY